jgi:two-component system response regulator PilR (NtrC family)
VLGDGLEISLEDLPASIQDNERMRRAEAFGDAAKPAASARTLEEIEMDCILQALDKTNHNRTQAARLLGITRRRLGYRISKYGLEEKLQEARRIVAEQRGELPVGAPEASDPT